MGLDMYLRKTKADVYDTASDDEELFYWRKHNALHNWFRSKYPEDEGDNLNRLPLTLEMLDELENDVVNGRLTPTAGSFFGPTDYDPMSHADEDLRAIDMARQAIADGYNVYYMAWY